MSKWGIPDRDTNRPPKGDRSEGFYVKISFFIDFSGFWGNFIKNNILIYGNWAGMTAEWSRIFLKVILVLDMASKLNFGPRNWIFHFFEIFNYQFSSKTHFFNHKIQDPSCRICSYGPHGPFLFSVKKGRDMEKRYQKIQNWKRTLFEIIRKMN